MRRKLDEKWIAHLLTLPESGMGYQRVDVLFKDGSTLQDIIVFNAQEIEVPDQYVDKEIAHINLKYGNEYLTNDST